MLIDQEDASHQYIISRFQLIASRDDDSFHHRARDRLSGASLYCRENTGRDRAATAYSGGAQQAPRRDGRVDLTGAIPR
jgi:hypothetical protein